MLWLMVGTGLSFLLIGSQWLTVARFDPQLPVQAIVVTFGGMLLRLGLATNLFLIVLPHGLPALLLVLLGFWIGRWLSLGWLALSNRHEEKAIWKTHSQGL